MYAYEISARVGWGVPPPETPHHRRGVKHCVVVGVTQLFSRPSFPIFSQYNLFYVSLLCCCLQFFLQIFSSTFSVSFTFYRDRSLSLFSLVHVQLDVASQNICTIRLTKQQPKKAHGLEETSLFFSLSLSQTKISFYFVVKKKRERERQKMRKIFL